MLRNFLIEEGDVPWDALKFMTGQITYGGRVTDDWDRRLLMVMLDKYYNDYTISVPDYKFSRTGLYYVPAHREITQARDYIENLPALEEPDIFGMHANADIAFLRAESQLILEAVLAV
jgi:dynein heavy chain